MALFTKVQTAAGIVFFACMWAFANTAFISYAKFSSAAADELSEGREEIHKAIVGSLPRESLDTRPIEFSVGGIHYRVTRNYLAIMADWNGGPQQGAVTLRINLPDLKPLSKETLGCFTATPAGRPPGCDPLSFRIYGPGGPSAAEAFERIRHLFHSQVPIETPYGFEKYEMGSDSARAEYYRKADDAGAPLIFALFLTFTAIETASVLRLAIM
jgi:hypothetical protein